jgi:hypothetical protein
VTVLEAAWRANRVVSTWTTDEVVHEDGWTVRDRWTGIFGAGDDRDSAYEDFHSALQEHLDVLSRQDALSPALSAQLEYLRRRLT